MADSPLIAPSRRALLRAGGVGFASLIVGTGVNAREVIARDDLEAVFREMGTVGTFVAHEVSRDRTTVVGRARAETRHVPASTFKIPNSLIALETGVVANAEEVFRYDGKPRRVKAWEMDMTLREAIAVSNVPVYQEIARRVGLSRYRDWLVRLDYGNRQPGNVVDTFWLEGPLLISAFEQAQFMARMASGALPVSKRSAAVVRDMIRLEAKTSRVLFGKTGWDGKLGWWVGWVEDGERLTAFALNIDMTRVEEAQKRIALGKELLARLNVY